jgi:hypothetical protein
MKMKKLQQLKKLRWVSLVAILLTFASCEKDLDIVPKDDDDFTSEKFYANPASYKQFLAKIYGGLALTGNSNVAGSSDLGTGPGTVDEGFSQYLRGYWQLQELPTDEAIIAWGDPTIPDLNINAANGDNIYVEAFFARVFFQIGLCNEYLRETTDKKLSDRNVTPELKNQIAMFRAEVRFLRALSYYHGVDIFGKLPFATDEDLLGTPPQMQTRAYVVNFILSELDAIAPSMAAPRTNEYARADQAAAWMLKAKVLLNSKVYTGVDKSAEALVAVNQVINSGYTIAQIPYANLFGADNNTNGAQNEIIFPIAHDGKKTSSYGGTTFLIKASVKNATIGATIGVNDGWGGYRVRKEFADIVGTNDARVMFQAGNADPASITDIRTFDQGKKLIKFTNLRSDSAPAQDQAFPDTDFPLFRMADAYLMYAELAANGQGDIGTAVGYVNALRTRANAAAPTITAADLTPQLVLNERAKELYWEGHRRQDLIRFGKFLSGYNWQWKGGAQSGVDLPAYRAIYPIPNKELNSNHNLSQNPGYN